MKSQQIYFLAGFLFFCFNYNLAGQQTLPTNSDLVISIEPQESNSLLTVTGRVKNITPNTFHLQYQLTVIQENSNYARNRQKNEFVLNPMEEVTLGNIKVGLNAKSVIQIRFEIFHDTTLISFMEISNELEKLEQGTGLVIDASRTKNGHDFYDLFNKQWMASEMETNAMIKIEEKPLQLRSTQILIYINDNLLIQQRLMSRYDQIEDQAENIFKAIFDYLQKNPSLNQEIEEGDLKGNGMNE